MADGEWRRRHLNTRRGSSGIPGGLIWQRWATSTLESEHPTRRRTLALLREQGDLRDERRLSREARLDSLVEQVQGLGRRLGTFKQVTAEQLDELVERWATAALHAAETRE